MAVIVINPPDEPLVSLEEAREHLGVDYDDADELIERLIVQIGSHLDGPEGLLQRALGEQTLEMVEDGFPSCSPYALKLRCPPVTTIDSVEYTDTDGVEQTLATSVYRLLGDGTPNPRIVLAYNQSWPSIRSEHEAVRVRYTAGYGAENLPAAIKAAILLMIGDLFAFRETAQVGSSSSEVPLSASVVALLAPYRVF